MSFLILMGFVMAVIGVVSLSLVGLFVSPWQVLLLFLVVVWGGTQWLLLQTQQSMTSQSRAATSPSNPTDD
ncbi:MAG: hypothetical protein KME16_15630 [Scytolyngbya sp. HA4215-MV1]|jgi:hypothetical protein|nr:hypothetical protein [Scytolyngbya sp. HA4215-MV1]